jgi:hypothetical protein
MPVEEWRAVPGYDGRYEVSDRGRVRSCDFTSVTKAGVRKRIRGRVLRQNAGSHGYPTVVLHLNGQRTFCVHRLVASLFLPDPSPGQTYVCHNDGDKLNATATNLRWDTPSANSLDKRRHGTDHEVNRTHCPRGHEYTAANTYVYKNRRNCRACRERTAA